MTKLNLKASAFPTYTMKLPIQETTHKFRPFLVKEEKILLIAAQSKDLKQINDAIRNIILSCTDGEIDTQKLCVADAEYAFLQIRCKSVGEEVKPKATCLACNTSTSIKIKLDEITINNTTKPKVNEVVPINDKISLVMRYPNIHDLNETKNPVEGLFEIAKSCIVAVVMNDNVHRREDLDETELGEFVDSLLPYQFEDIMKFLNSSPELTYNFKYTCPSCKKKVTVGLKSVSDFFL